MSKAKSKPQESNKLTPGPKPDILKIEGDWRDAVKKSFTKKKPAEGWPTEFMPTKPTSFSNPRLYVVIFRCERCNGPIINRVICEGPYPASQLAEHPFSLNCPICEWSADSREARQAEKTLQVDWNHKIHFQPYSDSTS